MRKLLFILGIPIGLVLLAIVLVPLFIDEKRLIDVVAKQLNEENGITLRVDGDAKVSLFPRASLNASDVYLEIPESNTQIAASSLRAGVALMPLLRSSVEVDSIEVTSLTITTEAVDEASAKSAAVDTSTLSNKELDAFYALRNKTRELRQAEAAAGLLAAPMALEVGELALRDIRLRTVDKAGALISEVLLKHLTASDLNLAGRASPISAHVIVPAVAEDGEDIEAIIAGDFTTNLKAETVALSSMAISVTGATPQAIKISLSGEAALDTQVSDMTLDLAIGDMRGSGELRFSQFESPMIDAKLALSELNPALLFLAGPDAGVAAAETAAADGEASDDSLPLHALRMIDTRAELSIDSVVLGAHVLTDVNTSLRVKDGVAELKPVKASVHGGAVDFTVVLNGRYNDAKLTTKGGVNDLDLQQAMAASDVGVAATGLADLNWDLIGSGGTVSELTESLSGPIALRTDAVGLQGISAEQLLCSGIALVNQESLTAEFPGDTQFTALSADILLQDGVAKLSPLTASMEALSLSGNGEVNLLTQDLRSSFRAQVSPALGELDPACRVNERIADLRWPVECKGNLADDPAGWCRVNTSEIIKDLAEGELKREVQKEAGRFLKKLFNQ
ncbi:MAG: AsmA family protein [Congregibacter sp.]